MAGHRGVSFSTPGAGSLRCLVAAGALAGAMAAPTIARADPWSSPAVLAGALPQRNLPDRFPVAAVNRHGQSLVAWNRDALHFRGVVVATGTARGRFSHPRQLTRTGSVAGAAIADDGTAVLVWQERDGSPRASVRHARGRFGRPQHISGSLRGIFSVPRVAVDRSGNALVVWTRSFGAGSQRMEQVQVVSLRAGGAFGSVSTLGAGIDARVALNARGDAVVSWTNVVETGGVFPVPFSRTSVAQVAIRPAGGTFAAPATVSATPTFGVRAAIGDGGTVAAAWEHANGPESDPYGAIQTSAQAVGGAFEAPVDAPAVNSRRTYGPMVMWGSQGELVTLWQEKARSTPFSTAAPVRWATRAPGGAFGPRRTVIASEVADPQLAPTGDGRALVVWADIRFGAALYRSGRGFVTASAPPGRPARIATRSLAAAGDFAVLAWQAADRRLVASVRRLPA